MKRVEKLLFRVLTLVEGPPLVQNSQGTRLNYLKKKIYSPGQDLPRPSHSNITHTNTFLIPSRSADEIKSCALIAHPFSFSVVLLSRARTLNWVVVHGDSAINKYFNTPTEAIWIATKRHHSPEGEP